jgi:hypothetical protein
LVVAVVGRCPEPLVIQPVETCPRQRQVAGFLDR